MHKILLKSVENISSSAMYSHQWEEDARSPATSQVFSPQILNFKGVDPSGSMDSKARVELC
jgi:hypothetical protein